MFQVLIVSFKHEFELVSQSHVTRKDSLAKCLFLVKKKTKTKTKTNK